MFVVPALFVVRATTESQAEEMAAKMQRVANRLDVEPNGVLFLDEELKTVKIELPVEATEYPHSLVGTVLTRPS